MLSSELKVFLRDLQAHPLWEPLIRQAVQAPQLRRFNPSRLQPDNPNAVDAETFRWAYDSGKRDQYDAFISALLGTKPKEDEDGR